MFSPSDKEILIFKKRRYARLLLRRAVIKGEITPEFYCKLCEKEKKTQAHHQDYGKPYDVIWLCTKCHGKVHRKDHPLNPNNCPQTPMPQIYDQFDAVTVTFNVPIKVFMSLKKKADDEKVTISQLMREKVEKECPVMDNQLKFDFEVKNDKPQNVRKSRIWDLEKDKKLLQQSERSNVQEIWGERNKSGSLVATVFPNFFEGRRNGTEGLQRI